MLFGRSKLLHSLLLLSAAIAYPLCLVGQQGWSIIGTIETFRGELPDRPIEVTLQFRGNTIATTFSDSEGKFSFSELLANAYHVLVDDEKFRPVDQIVEINPMLTAPTMVRINLTPKDAPKTGSPAPGSNPNMVNSLELKQFPKGAVKEFDKGIKSDKEGRSDEAIQHYERAVTLAPDFYAAHNNLGSAYLAKSQFNAAQEQFEQVINANPSDAAAYFNLGNLLLLQENYVDAVHWLGEGLTRQPNSPLGHFLIGSVFMRVGRAELAEKELRNSLQLDPKMSKAHLALVNLYMHEKRKPEAVTELKSFLKSFPEDPLALKASEVLKKLEAGGSNP